MRCLPSAVVQWLAGEKPENAGDLEWLLHIAPVAVGSVESLRRLKHLPESSLQIVVLAILFYVWP